MQRNDGKALGQPFYSSMKKEVTHPTATVTETKVKNDRLRLFLQPTSYLQVYDCEHGVSERNEWHRKDN